MAKKNVKIKMTDSEPSGDRYWSEHTIKLPTKADADLRIVRPDGEVVVLNWKDGEITVLFGHKTGGVTEKVISLHTSSGSKARNYKNVTGLDIRDQPHEEIDAE